MNAAAIDHLVLPVGNLSVARSRLTKLGFTVAPDGLHPFGTANACVFLADGTYLEPLGITNRRQATVAAQKGNVFAARACGFQTSRKREGLSALAIATDDAAADQARFQLEGISAGEMLEFARQVKMPDGSGSEARFRLAFAGDQRAPDFFFFTVQRLDPLPADREALERHSNAVTGIGEVILAADDPGGFAALAEAALGCEPESQVGIIRFAAANGHVRLASNQDLESELALPASSQTGGLLGRAIIFKTADLAVTEITLAANDVTFIRREGRVLVQAAQGQGVLFGFEE